MLRITDFTCEHLQEGCVTDRPHPRFSFAAESGRQGAVLRSAAIRVAGCEFAAGGQIDVPYAGEPLRPFTRYTAELSAEDDAGETASARLTFETGRMGAPWAAQWITDGSYRFTEKKTSPVPLTFRRVFACKGQVESARIYATALGIYELQLNGEKVGDEFFAPGFTSYKNNLQYQVYDVTAQLQKNNALTAVVAGGWAVGAFVMNRKNRITAPRQAFLAEIRIRYADGSEEVFGTDTSWQVTREGNVRFAEFYDGETYDATVDLDKAHWHAAAVERVKIHPSIEAACGAPVRAHEVFAPVAVTRTAAGEVIYDMGQNFAGVVRLHIEGAEAGQQIVVRHAEILTESGELNTAFLRTAKCTATYICRAGAQVYMPRMTYMGFRYVGIRGIAADRVRVEGVALYSDMEKRGSFTCSDERINQLQSNLVWSGKSNFVDIPTDCPQRDERMGWTGDIALFASTACYNFDARRFLEKWLKDVKAEQTRHGGIPNTVPVQGYGFPLTMPKKAIAFWGDACIFVPWAMYLAYGDTDILAAMYPTMQRYIKACKFWAGFLSCGKNKYIWNDIPAMQFGDWVAPDVPNMGQWQARCKWTGTAALCRSSALLANIACLLGKAEDAAYYKDLSEKVADAYCSVLTDGHGKLLEEFQTAYVLPLHFGMFPESVRAQAAQNLAALIKKNDYCIGTGFPGTPYILFALADNGHADTAFKMLTNTKCPSWLYEVKVGATTIWERWDALDEQGRCTIGEDGTGGMISFNHYAFGAVGDFLYRRVAGIEPLEGGYKRFAVKPLVGGGITSAKAALVSPYGKIESSWQAEGGKFTLHAKVPMGTVCELTLPNGETKSLASGSYEFTCAL